MTEVDYETEEKKQKYLFKLLFLFGLNADVVVIDYILECDG